MTSIKLKTATILKKAIFGETIKAETILSKHSNSQEYGKNSIFHKKAAILKDKFDKIFLEKNDTKIDDDNKDRSSDMNKECDTNKNVYSIFDILR